MMRRVAFLLIGAVFLGLGGTMLSFSLAALVRGGAAELNVFVLVPAVFVVLGLVLVITSLRGMMRSRERRAMPLAPVRPAPAPAGSGRWELVDVASEIARRLEGSPCSVHVAGERVEIRWAGESAAQERCELRATGDGALSHTDVIESAFEVLRLHRGAVFRAGPSRRGWVRGGASSAFEPLDRRAVHRALDEALAIAGWRRAG